MNNINIETNLLAINVGWDYMGRKLDAPRYWLKNDLIRRLNNDINERKIHNEKRN